jgi:phage terminase small subunit
MLTDQQENFARAIALEGMNQSDAYRACYNTETERQETVWSSASVLANDPKVAARIDELRGETAAPQIMSAIQRREALTGIANDPNASYSDRMKAIDLLNKMDGEYVQKVQAEVKSETTINIELVDDDE